MTQEFRGLVSWLIEQAKERTIAREQKGRYYYVPGNHKMIKRYDPKLFELLKKRSDATRELDEYLLTLK